MLLQNESPWRFRAQTPTQIRFWHAISGRFSAYLEDLTEHLLVAASLTASGFWFVPRLALQKRFA
jgi:hypothetical protein